ncbi:hypothetical protein DFJ74DRAFT_738802 [Hyaloraphidium curvatum]|nr:hypothetical protein DFJ74DRAFT_738802 [Hyaloraphidium curvatum]
MRTTTLDLPFAAARFTSTLAPSDHPLFASLVLACRKGDLETVKRLIAADVPVNARDAFDATPLYYSALCGHEAVVRFLLGAGAQADPTTFEGERCLYGALTDSIRALLRNHKYSTRRDERQDFALWLAGLLAGSRLLHDPGHESPALADFPPDFAFYLSGERIPAHRFLLAARSPFFAANLATRWRDADYARVRSRVDADVFRACIRWFYTGRADDTVPESLYPEWIRVCGALHLGELRAQVEELQRAAEERELWEREHPHHGRHHHPRTAIRAALGARNLTGKVEDIMGELAWLVGCLISSSLRGGAAPGPIAPEANGNVLRGPSKDHSSSSILALERALAAFRATHPAITDPLSPPPIPEHGPLVEHLVAAARPDLLISVGPRTSPTLLRCHSGVLRSRSPYFSAMLSGGFSEPRAGLVRLEEPADPRVAVTVLHFLYSDALFVPQALDTPSVHDLLPAPALLLLPRLTSLVASYILHPARERAWDKRDVLRLLEAAERLGVGRVEAWATARVAAELEGYLLEGEEDAPEAEGEEEEETLREMLVRMIAESAEWVREREEEDSVPLLDDLRYHLARRFGADDPLSSLPLFGRPQEESDTDGALYARLAAELDAIREELGVQIVDVTAFEEPDEEQEVWEPAPVGKGTAEWIAEEADEGWMDGVAGVLGDEDEEAEREERRMAREEERGRRRWEVRQGA